MKWKQAVQQVARTNPRQMQAVAASLVDRIEESERAEALVRALMREAHVQSREVVRLEEHRASRSESGRPRPMPKKVNEELRKRLGPVLSSWREELRLTWTEELRHSEFTLRDGSFVSWGYALIPHHKERIDIFMENAAANVDGAAKHSAAIRQIEALGVSCLNECIVEAERESVEA